MIQEAIIDLDVRPINRSDALPYFAKHYINKAPAATKIYIGVFFKDVLHGVITYGNPSSPSASGAVAKKDSTPLLGADEIFELTRLFIEDIVGLDNIESSVISRANKLVHDHFPNVKVIVTYADPSQGHFGIIYQSTGAIYQGRGRDYNAIKNTNTGKTYSRAAYLIRDFGTSNLEKLMAAGHPVSSSRVSGKMRYIYILRGKKKIEPFLTSNQPYVKKGQMEFPLDYKRMNKSKSIAENEMGLSPSLNAGGMVNPGMGTYASPDVSQFPVNFAKAGEHTIDSYTCNRNDGPAQDDIDAIKHRVTPDEILCGIEYELKKMQQKNKSTAKAIVVKNLQKDPKYYSSLRMLNIDNNPMNESVTDETKRAAFNEIFKDITDNLFKTKARKVDSRVTDAYKESVKTSNVWKHRGTK